jgi:hypothetical protein
MLLFVLLLLVRETSLVTTLFQLHGMCLHTDIALVAGVAIFLEVYGLGNDKRDAPPTVERATNRYTDDAYDCRHKEIAANSKATIWQNSLVRKPAMRKISNV